MKMNGIEVKIRKSSSLMNREKKAGEFRSFLMDLPNHTSSQFIL